MTPLDLLAAEPCRSAAARVPRTQIELKAYGLVSAAALACDWRLLVGLAAAGLPCLAASTISFISGMAVAYALSIRFVFATRRAVSREAEAGGFFAVGLVCLLLTRALLFGHASNFAAPAGLIKAPAAAKVFLFKFARRRGLVFAASPRS